MIKKLNLWPKSFFDQPFCLLCLAAAQKIAHTAHSLYRLGELHVKAGYGVHPTSWVAQLARAPSPHVNRPLTLYNSSIKIFLLDFTPTLSCLHYVIAFGMQIKTASHQEFITRLIHKARHGSIQDKIMPVNHSLPLLLMKFFSGQHTSVSTPKCKLSIQNYQFICCVKI